MEAGEGRLAYLFRPSYKIPHKSSDLTILLAAACILLGGMLALYALAILGATDDPTYSVTAAFSFG
jgi:Flp pilus assembly protein protease CpaA